VVGMGAFFAGVANAPIASLMMVCELTGAYELLPPLMVVAIVALVTSRRWSIYTTQVDNKFSTKAHLWEMNPNFLKRMSIGNAMRGVYDRSAIISRDLPLVRIEEHAHESGESDLILTDERGDLAGLLSLTDLDGREGLGDLGLLVVADDLINHRTVCLSPEDNLIRALEFFGDDDFANLPIVDNSDVRNKLLGHVCYRDIVGFYQREHESMMSDTAGHPSAPPA
jgi:CIC family chloride channel protein